MVGAFDNFDTFDTFDTFKHEREDKMSPSKNLPVHVREEYIYQIRSSTMSFDFKT